MDYTKYIDEVCLGAKKASRAAASMSISRKIELLKNMADRLEKNSGQVVKENLKDLEKAEKNGLSAAMVDRLRLTPERISGMAASIREIAAQDDPVGRIEGMTVRPSGIRVGRMRVPVGVVAVIYESRPNVTTDIAALCIKSGNAAILRGGKEAIHTNTALYSVISESLKEDGADTGTVVLITKTDRELLTSLLKRSDSIDIVIPRGGPGLIQHVTEESTIPVIKHDKGLCSVFVDSSASPEMAEKIAVNSKAQRPGVCNAAETLLVHREYSEKASLFQALISKGVELRGCAEACSVLPGSIKEASPEDYDTEFLGLVMAVRVVGGIDEAMDHIANHGSGHSEAIVTENYSAAERFLREVDSAAVFVNASTRFHDGGEFGLGAEVGISTQKLHARGAMGAEGLTTLKYVVYGNGEVR